MPQGPLFVRCFHNGAEIENEAFVFPLARFLVRLSKQRGWVNCSQNFWRNLDDNTLPRSRVTTAQ